jgi:hypothetical protein
VLAQVVRVLAVEESIHLVAGLGGVAFRAEPAVAKFGTCPKSNVIQ